VLRSFDVPTPFLLLLPFTCGWAGVACFSGVSGFCIHLSGVTVDGKASWSVFALRRFLRLYPPYFVAVCLFFIVSVVVGTTQLHRISSCVQLGAHLSMLHNFDQRTLFGINPLFWSVAVEVQLYLLYPLVWYLSRRLGWRLPLVFVGLPERLTALASSVSLNMLGVALPCCVVN
jgi:peptidoglycan/LPS O-acetylase OafA/YrhL